MYHGELDRIGGSEGGRRQEGGIDHSPGWYVMTPVELSATMIMLQFDAGMIVEAGGEGGLGLR